MAARKPDELLIYGVHAVRAVYKKRPDDVIRMYVRQDRLATEAKVLRFLAAKKRAYHLVNDEELEKICKSVHHDGLAALIHCAPPLSAEQFREILQCDQKNQMLIWCDGLENPHNLGAIIRSAAHFGIKAMVITGTEQGSQSQSQSLPLSLPAAAVRVAMGGNEAVPVFFSKSISEVQALCQEFDYKIFSSSSHHGQDLYLRALPQRVAMILGAESTGVHADLMKFAEHQICIKGTGAVESLNVSVAAALIMGEYSAQYR